MGAHRLAAGLLLLAAVGATPTGLAHAEPAPTAPLRAVAVRDSVRALTLRRAYAEADSLAAAALASLAREGVADSLLGPIADWRLEAFRRAGKYGRPEAWEAAAQAVQLKERAFGNEHPEVARTLALASIIYQQAGKREEAERLARRSVTIYERSGGADSLPLARALQLWANVRVDQAEYTAARAIYDRSIAIREKLLGADHPEVATGLNALAILLRRMGEYEEARRVHERAIRIRERSLPPDDPDLAWSLNNYANVLFDLGEISATKPIHERVLAMRLRTLGPDHPDVAFSYNNLANTLHALGDFAGARRMLEASLRIREATLGTDHVDVAQSLNNLAYLLRDAGDYEEARALYERSLAIRERARGTRHPDVTITLDRLAQVLADLGDLEGARRGLERSLSINRTAFGDDHTETAETMSVLAGVEAARGDTARAEALYERAIEINLRLREERSPNQLHNYNGLAGLRIGRGRAAETCSLLQRSLALYREEGLDATPDAAWSWASLGEALARSGRPGEALEAALRAEDIGCAHLRLTARSIEEPLALRYAATRPGGRDIALTLLEDERSDPVWRARVWDAVIHARAAVVDELAGRQRSSAAVADPAARALSDSLARVRERLARLVLSGSRDMPPERYSALVQAAGRVKVEIERELAERSAAFRIEEATRVAGVAEVSAALPRGAALVAYVAYRGTALRVTDREGELRYGAFVIRGNPSPVTYHSLGPAAAIDSAANAWRNEASRRPSPTRRAAAERRCLLLGQRLRALVWDPIHAEIEGAKLVLVVPDGVLQRVPLAALPAPGEGYLVQSEPPIQILPAERDLLNLERETPGGRGVLALGGPDFDARVGPAPIRRPARMRETERSGPGAEWSADCRESALALRFGPLPGARQEAIEIARRWGRGEETVVLVDERATEEAVKEIAPGRRVVHLATHGFFLRPLCPPRVPSAPGGPAARDVRVASDPLLRAGLALAGANGRRRPDAVPEDGLLTAEEIAGLDLRGVEWVVLSACETGAGHEHVSEGLLGLRRAFQSAGARSVISSMWRVDDAWTLRWMRSLYQARFEGGLSTAEAVRRAAIQVLEASDEQTGSTHPYVWGAFVAAGDWR
ncbi:MAG TPA: CHAT domain-containing tetratricopeptide repeat protein [Candidatus Eisenbacteria bacterium]|jgi:CHAT domain-containing protein/tetratricopeptide (TPR) repeat protein